MFLPCFLLARCSQWLLDYDLNAPSAGGEFIVSIIGSNATSEQALYRLLRLFYKSQSALMPLLLLPKSQPLRWVVILFWGASLKISASKVLGCYTSEQARSVSFPPGGENCTMLPCSSFQTRSAQASSLFFCVCWETMRKMIALTGNLG